MTTLRSKAFAQPSLADVLRSLSRLEKAETSSEKNAASSDVQQILADQKARMAQHFTRESTRVVIDTLSRLGVSLHDVFFETSAVVYRDVAGWRVAVYVPLIQSHDTAREDLEESLMDSLGSWVSSKNLEAVVNDICVNRLQWRSV